MKKKRVRRVVLGAGYIHVLKNKDGSTAFILSPKNKFKWAKDLCPGLYNQTYRLIAEVEE